MSELGTLEEVTVIQDGKEHKVKLRTVAIQGSGNSPAQPVKPPETTKPAPADGK